MGATFNGGMIFFACASFVASTVCVIRYCYRICCRRGALSYSSLTDDTVHGDAEASFVHSFCPRSWLWLQQVAVLMCSFTTSAEVCSLSRVEGWHSLSSRWPLLCIALSQILSLLADNLDKLTWVPGRLVWLPSHTCNYLYFLFHWIDGGSFSLSYCDIEFLSSGLALLGAIMVALRTRSIPQRNPPTEEFTSGLFSYLSFSYLNGVINIATTKVALELTDVPGLIDDDSCACVYETLQRNGTRHSLARKLYLLIRTELWIQGVFQLVSSIVAYLPPLALKSILAHVGKSGDTGHVATPWLHFEPSTAVILLFVGPLVKSICDGQNYNRARRIAVRVRAALITLLYRKSLNVDLTAVEKGAGSLNNLISVDLSEVQDLACFFHYLWCTIFEASICLTLLFVVLGPAALGGIFVMLISMPIGAYATKRLDTFQSRLMTNKDERMSVVQEAIQGIRILKWFAWEDRFLEKIASHRQKELNSLWSYVSTDAMLKINMGLVPTFVGLVSFLTHTVILGRVLDPSVGFTAILLFNFLRSPVNLFPDMVNTLVRARLSCRRIEAYLRTDDVSGLEGNRKRSGDSGGGGGGGGGAAGGGGGGNKGKGGLDKETGTMAGNSSEKTTADATTVRSPLPRSSGSEPLEVAGSSLAAGGGSLVAGGGGRLPADVNITSDAGETVAFASPRAAERVGSSTSVSLRELVGIFNEQVDKKKAIENEPAIIITNATLAWITASAGGGADGDDRNPDKRKKNRKTGPGGRNDKNNQKPDKRDDLSLKNYDKDKDSDKNQPCADASPRQSPSPRVGVSSLSAAGAGAVRDAGDDEESLIQRNPALAKSLQALKQMGSGSSTIPKGSSSSIRNPLVRRRSGLWSGPSSGYQAVPTSSSGKYEDDDFDGDASSGGKGATVGDDSKGGNEGVEMISRPLRTGSRSFDNRDETNELVHTDVSAEVNGHSLRDVVSDGDRDLCVILKNISLTVPKGSLVAVCGSTGAGKSTLISGILGECKILEGGVTVNGRLSFACQSAWIQNASLRNNILFGRDYDENRYKEVIRACALDVDLTQLKDGDQTDIGEKGVNLSGGQQQRVSLARAAYSDSDIIILDDPLSAVDAHVGDHIFFNLICGYLSNRTRVLVTNQVALVVPECDLVVVLDSRGGIAACCPPGQLARELSPFSTKKSEKSEKSSDTGFFELLSALPTKRASSHPVGTKAVPASALPKGGDGDRDEKGPEADSVPGQPAQEVTLLVQRETSGTGAVTFSVYWFYFTAAGGVLAIVMMMTTNLGLPTAWFLSNYTLGEWMEAVEHNNSNQGEALALYLSAVAGVLVATIVKFLVNATVVFRAAKKLHGTMAERVLFATMAWFDATPTGRLINRFSQDIATVDTTLMNHLNQFLDRFTGSVQVLLVVSATLPVMLVCFLPVLAYFGFVSGRYFKVSRDLKRLESVNKSPVFVLFSETLHGLSTIRAFCDQERFFQLCCSNVDNMNRCHLYMWISNRWLNARTQFIGALVSGGVAYLVVNEAHTLGSTIAGLALVYAINFTEQLTFLSRAHSDVQIDMNSVERIKEYCSVDQEKYEPDATTTTTTTGTIVHSPVVKRPGTDVLPKDWPSKGEIRFENICMRYREGIPPVLKDVSFVVEAGKKIGICGRSGAGKSSLLAALFRTVEPYSGRLLIDGVDILKLPLRTLRSRLAIVPQDPVLFKGTIKSNLDPFDQADDDDLWNALRRVHMSAAVAAMPGGTNEENGPLDEKIVMERGSNLSLGQRQLLCMARAILRGAKILIMDEATASVDAETDALIQDTVRKEFEGVTVLSIAHRLHTIAFYDKVLVMDAGTAAECDTPRTLMERKNSIFRSMCLRTGDYDLLHDIAMGLEKSARKQS